MSDETRRERLQGIGREVRESLSDSSLEQAVIDRRKRLSDWLQKMNASHQCAYTSVEDPGVHVHRYSIDGVTLIVVLYPAGGFEFFTPAKSIRADESFDAVEKALEELWRMS